MIARLYCATGNQGKLREFQSASGPFEIIALPDFEKIPLCQETGATFEENALQKAEYYSDYAPGLLFADDSGLVIDSLGGEPGAHSARYAGAHATDAENNRLVLERLRGCTQRSARFVCVIALAGAGKAVRAFRGEVEGEILPEERGTQGFGYDPLFFSPLLGRSFAEVSAGAKFQVSHRGKALRAMLEFLRSYDGTLTPRPGIA